MAFVSAIQLKELGLGDDNKVADRCWDTHITATTPACVIRDRHGMYISPPEVKDALLRSMQDQKQTISDLPQSEAIAWALNKAVLSEGADGTVDISAVSSWDYLFAEDRRIEDVYVYSDHARDEWFKRLPEIKRCKEVQLSRREMCGCHRKKITGCIRCDMVLYLKRCEESLKLLARDRADREKKERSNARFDATVEDLVALSRDFDAKFCREKNVLFDNVL